MKVLINLDSPPLIYIMPSEPKSIIVDKIKIDYESTDERNRVFNALANYED